MNYYAKYWSIFCLQSLVVICIIKFSPFSDCFHHSCSLQAQYYRNQITRKLLIPLSQTQKIGSDTTPTNLYTIDLAILQGIPTPTNQDQWDIRCSNEIELSSENQWVFAYIIGEAFLLLIQSETFLPIHFKRVSSWGNLVKRRAYWR